MDYYHVNPSRKSIQISILGPEFTLMPLWEVGTFQGFKHSISGLQDRPR